MSSAMQDMLLNMILPKDQQEELKRILTPENIKNVAAFVKNDYQQLKADIQEIKDSQNQILELLNARGRGNESGRGAPKLAAIGNGGSSDNGAGTGTDG